MANSARIDELRKKFDENPRRYFAPLANEYRKQGDLEQAIFICQEYLPQQPGHMSGHIVYGQALFESGRIDEARGVFETALTLDPENLIALRHLGDIAAAGGDIGGARAWYHRVLEVDPRNEEIAALIAGLDGVPATGAHEPSSPSEPVSIQSTDSGQAATPDLGPIDGSVAAAPTVSPLELASAASSDELLDLRDSAVTTPSHASLAVPPSNPNAGSVDSDSAPPGDGFGGVGFGVTAGSADIEREGDLSADFSGLETTNQGIGRLELPNDDSGDGGVLDIPIAGLQLSEQNPKTSDPYPAAEGLDSMAEFTVLEEPAGGVADSREAVDQEATAQSNLAVPASLDPISKSGPPVDVPSPTAQSPFVTETMAELYLQQGHLESALDIFTTLLEQRPGDARLSARRQSVEQALYGGHSPDGEGVDATDATGPTIREFLAGFLGARGARGQGTIGGGAGGAAFDDDAGEEQVRPEDSSPAAGNDAADDQVASARYDAPVELPRDERVDRVSRADASSLAADSDPTPTDTWDASQRSRGGVSGDFIASSIERANRPTPSTSTDSLSGSIDSLFGGVKAAQPDVAAATVLADAFDVEKREAPLLAGAPARRATNELSLDHVFRAGTPQQESDSPEATAGFSFDQFFADESTETRPASTTDAPSASRSSSEDIAQFNAWLSGLKKT